MAAKASPRFRDLPDVDWPSFADGEVPVYNSATGKLEGQVQSGGGGGAPSGPAGGDLTGTYPNPSIEAGVILDADVNASAAIAEAKLALASDAAAGTASRRTLGSGATQAAPGNDSRLSDQRVPTDGSVTNAKVAIGAAIAEAKLDLAPKVPATAEGYARGGPLDVNNEFGYLNQPNRHQFTTDGADGGTVLFAELPSGGVALYSHAVATNDLAVGNVIGNSSELLLLGDGDVQFANAYYAAVYTGGAGEINTITGFYLDDDYGYPGDGDYQTVDVSRGFFVESKDAIRARKVYAFHTRQGKTPHTGSPPGAQRWAYAATGDAPSVLGGAVQILLDHNLFDLSNDPPVPEADDALLIGTLASNRNLVVKKSGTVLFATDTNLFRSAADTLKTDDSFHVGATFRHLGSSAGFYGVAAVARPAAYTQTYATASRTHAAPTATSVSTTTGISGFGSTAERQSHDAAINNLITDHANTKQVLNQLLDDLQLEGLLQ